MKPIDLLQLEKEQRTRNARHITLAIAVLKAVGLFTGLLFTMEASAWRLLFVTTAVHGLAHLLVRRKYVKEGVFLCLGALLFEFISLVPVSPYLGPLPYLTSLVVLISAATMGSRQLPVAFGGALLAIGAQAFLAPGGAHDTASITAAVSFSVVVFLVSWLHMRGTRHAFRIASALETERAKAAAQALCSEQRYRLIADNTRDLIALMNTEGQAEYLSPSHSILLGQDLESCLGQPLSSLLQVRNSDEAAAMWQKTVEHGEARQELEFIRPDGSLLVFDSSLKRVEADDGPLVAAISRDITENRKLQQKLLSNERLQSLGQLAGSVAHDFNNLLTVIGGTVELAAEVIPTEHEAQKDLLAALQATEAAGRLTSQLLTFSKRQIVIEEDLDVGHELTVLRPLLQAIVGNRVELNFEIEENLPPVRMSSSHLEQLVMNLVVNARDAILDGGRLHLGVRSPERATTQDLQQIELWVRDEGVGVPDSARPHLFDPFFTTKGDAGTGLGLATCAAIVEQLGGSIRLDPTVKTGACFRALVPIAPSEKLPTQRKSIYSLPDHVLVVDDERSIRQTTLRLLKSLGCHVRTAATLAEAHAIIADNSVPLEALLTDVVLRDGNGTDLLDKCRSLRPDLTIVVMSGYTPEKNASVILRRNNASFLPKPFTKQQLIGALSSRANEPPSLTKAIT